MAITESPLFRPERKESGKRAERKGDSQKELTSPPSFPTRNVQKLDDNGMR